MTELLERNEVYEHSPDPRVIGEEVMSIETNPHLQRSLEVGDAIDPEHTLPEVAVEPDPSYRVGREVLFLRII